MKDSGIEWIGIIPESWGCEPIGSHFECRNTKVSDKDYPPLSVAKIGVVPQMENVAKTDANDARKLVKAGDFVINSRSDRKQSCGVADRDGSVSMINIVLCNRSKSLTPKYMGYSMKNYGFAEEFYRWGNGIVADLWSTRWDNMKRIYIPIPPIPEQQEIATFLDQKCKEVDELIDLQEKMIEELKAYKQSVITETITKGLNPDAPMKDSGIEWIGQIPKTWSVLPMGKFFTFGKGLPITKADLVEKGEKVISYGQIHSKKNDGLGINPELFRYVQDTYLKTHPQCLLKKGDYAFADTSEDPEGAGNFMYINTDDTILAGYHTIIARPSASLNHAYLKFLFLSDIWRMTIRASVSGVKVFSISNRLLKRTSLLLPPDEEQIAIVEKLTDVCQSVDEIIFIKQSKISELQDYKKSLIYEYVTGKKEVL